MILKKTHLFKDDDFFYINRNEVTLAMGFLFLTLGMVGMFISLLNFISKIKESNSIKDKLVAFLDFILDPFVGSTSLFYLGFLSTVLGLLILLNII